ncbi:hypothetical protein O3M35_000283 [Rhynocoris fuscipes]|uniref:RNA helicase n=1 Tax=Rhynocoris fuscipes TaxID=488301 RepID=A0AAW1DMV7_9HEMI
MAKSINYPELKTEMKTLTISDKSKDIILETLKYLHGEEFIHKEKSAYKDRRMKLDRQYWLDRGNLVVQGGINFSKKDNSDEPGNYGNKFALSKLERYGFHKFHCEDALKIVGGDVGAAYELLMCRYFNWELPEKDVTPQNLLEERSQELDSLKEIYGNCCEEKIVNQLWVFHLDLKYLADTEIRDNSKTSKGPMNWKKTRMNKDVCRFYFKGTCRFGNKCRFSHSAPQPTKTEIMHYEDPTRNKFDLEVRFPIGSTYPLEPPMVSLIAQCQDFPPTTCLRVTNHLLKEVKKAAGMQQPTIYTIIDLLCNRQEEVLRVLEGPSSVFYDPSMSLLPENLPSGIQNGHEEDDDYDHLWSASYTKSSKPDLDSELYRIDDELSKKFVAKTQDQRYKSMLEKRFELPTWTKKDEIIDVVKRNQVVILSGETGCGKSTQIPQFLLDDWLYNGDMKEHIEIICTQPRRISAIGVAERVAAERIERIGETVGYQIRLETKVSYQTRLLFCTTGILLRRLEKDPYLNNISHVVVDEVHERSEESDFLLLILKDLLKKRNDLKILLMSATLNSELFCRYFPGAPVIHIPGRTFPVEQLFLEDIIMRINYVLEEYSQYSRKVNKSNSRDLENLESVDEIDSVGRGILYPNPKSPDEYLSPKQLFYRYRDYSREVCKTLYLTDSERLNFELIEDLLTWIVEGNHDYPREGSILVFLPGIGEIMSMYDQLKANSVFSGRNGRQFFTLIPLHSSLTNEEQSLVFRKPRMGERRIVLSTNIAETSITIDDCVFVIDCGKMKEKGFDSNKNMESLETVWVSRANALQRKGRAGRVMAGVCFHLYTRHRFEVILEPQPVPEICRVPLEQLVLRIKMLPHLSDRDLLEVIQQLIEPPKEDNLMGAITRLQNIGALDECKSLTPLGKHLASLPVDVRIGKLILSGAMFCALDSTLTMAACLSYKSPFVAPLNKKDEAAKRKKDFVTGNSDHLTTLNAYRCWQRESLRSRQAGYNFANEHYLSHRTLSTLADIKAQLLELLIDIGFVPGDIKVNRRRNNGFDRISEITGPELNVNGDNQKLLAAILCAALYPNIVKVMTPDKHYTLSLAGALPRQLKPEEIQFKTRNDGFVHLHPSSVNFERTYFPSPYLVYQEKIKTTKVFVRDCTMVPCLALVLFSAGKLKVELNYGEFIISLADGWILFSVPSNEIAELLESIKNELQILLEEKIREPRLNLQTHPRGKKIISTIVHVVTHG